MNAEDKRRMDNMEEKIDHIGMQVNEIRNKLLGSMEDDMPGLVDQVRTLNIRQTWIIRAIIVIISILFGVGIGANFTDIINFVG